MAFMHADESAQAGELPTDDIVDAMMRYNEDLAKAGVLLAAEGLHPSSRGARIDWSGTGAHHTTVLDGPFAEAKEVIAGYWMWRVDSMAEAIEWARRCPLGPGAWMEVREIFEVAEFGESLTQEQRERDDAIRDEIERNYGGQ